MNTLDNLKNSLKNISGKKAAIVLASFAAAMLIFEFGAIVGYHQAQFSFHGSERYMRMMDGDGGNQFFMSRGQIHGAAGRIVSVDLPTFTVVGPDNIEKRVTINGGTIITRFKSVASTSAIKPDDLTVVLGDPDDSGVIDARFVRLMPALGTTSVQKK